jgi:hypothetical protein
MDTLPLEIIELIATQSSQLWFTLVQVFRSLADRASIMLPDLQNKFLFKTSNKFFSILYQLPNGVFHNFEEPSIVSKDHTSLILHSGDSVWYWQGEIHRENDQPAIIYAGHQEWR